MFLKFTVKVNVYAIDFVYSEIKHSHNTINWKSTKEIKYFAYTQSLQETYFGDYSIPLLQRYTKKSLEKIAFYQIIIGIEKNQDFIKIILS